MPKSKVAGRSLGLVGVTLMICSSYAATTTPAPRVTCTASFNTTDNSLSIEAVTLGSSRYQAKLTLLSGATPSFRLDSITATTSPCYDTATYNGVLNVPDVSVGAVNYSVNLKLANSSSPYQFSLDSASKNLHLRPDPGLRVSKASNPFATVDSNGVAYLGYQDRSTNSVRFQSASDGLTFGNATTLTYNNRSVDSRKTLMPDNKTWRLYQYDLVSKVIGSYSSSDGNVFTADTGTRYAPAAGDNNTIGVYDSYVAPDKSVILIYVGDLMAKNNLRMARSTDNGLTFSFLKSNVLGDDDAGGGGSTFIDNKTMLLDDGRRRMITMRANELQSFISSDGVTYTREPGVRLKISDFASVGVTIYSLNDPVMVKTKEGKIRVYVAASTAPAADESASNSNWAIVSAVFDD